MKFVLRAFAAIHGLMALLFVGASLMLIVIATKTGWLAFASGLNLRTAQEIIEAVGLLAAAVVALQIAQTIAEEEVVREAHVSGPTRVRRFLSRFMVVSAAYGDFSSGSVLTTSLAEIVSAAAEAPQGWIAEYLSGVEACRAECAYFGFCGGAHAANRFFEHGRFDGTQTRHCRNSKIFLLEGVLDHARAA